MAFSQTQWDKAKILYELGKSLREIERDTGISNGQIAKKAKKDGWEHKKKKQLKADIIEYESEKEALEAKKEALIADIASLSALEITILDDVVTNEVGIKSLLFSASTLAVARSNAQLTKNKKTTIVKVKQYNDNGQVCGETIEMAEIELSPDDIKTHIEAIDKASLTLGINPRHAPKVEVSQTNQTAIAEIRLIDA